MALFARDVKMFVDRFAAVIQLHHDCICIVFAASPRTSDSMTQRLQGSLDRLAIGVSTICAFHCLLLPVVIVLFPTLSAVLGSDETFHRVLVLFVVPSSVAALALGCWRHRDRAVLVLGISGIVLLLLTLALGHVEHWERACTVAGSGLVLLAHVRNYRLCRRNDCSHHESGQE